MTDDKFANAVDVIAKNLLTSCAAVCEKDWEDYPDLGENDWEQVRNRVRDLVDLLAPSPPEYEAAYEYLAERARGEPA